MPSRSSQLQIRVTDAQKRQLRRLAEAAGLDMSAYVLRRVLVSESAELGRLVAKLPAGTKQSYVWAALHDLLNALDPSEYFTVTDAVDASKLPPFEANFLAAMIEHAATQKSADIPAWTSAIPPLSAPWFGTSLKNPRLRLHLLRASPAAYKRRNLFVDSAVGDRV